MNGTTFVFKTNMKCSGCVEKVTPALNSLRGITRWDVDLANPDRLLSVESDGATEPEIIEAVQSAGYKIEPVDA
jgi:copper chaperone